MLGTGILITDVRKYGPLSMPSVPLKQPYLVSNFNLSSLTNPMHCQDLLLAMFTALRDWKGVTGECSILMSECREYYNSRSRPGSPG